MSQSAQKLWSSALKSNITLSPNKFPKATNNKKDRFIEQTNQINSMFSSNNTLKYFQGTNRPTYYLTAFVRAKVISISTISYQQMSANLNCQLFIDISYRGIGLKYKNKILQKGIRLSFQKDQMLLLTRDNPDVFIHDNESEKRIQFVIRKFIKTGIVCERLFLSPFEIIKCQIALRINYVKIKQQDETDEIEKHHISHISRRTIKQEETFLAVEQEKETYQYNFNMMDHPNNQIKVSNSIDSNFGLFQIASAMLEAKYFTSFEQASEKKKKDKKKNKMKDAKKVKRVNVADVSDDQMLLIKKKYGDQKLLSFNVAVFYIPLYKKPVVANLTIFLPLLILSLTNLGVFFCQPDIFKRISAIAAIMVSFVALIPTMRQQIPPTSTITLVEILVFFQSFTAIIALFHSISIIGEAEGWVLDYMHDPLFWAAVVITIIVNLIVLILSLTYKFKWRPQYTKNQVDIFNQFKQDEFLNIYEWSNERCDGYFKSYFEKDTIKVIEDSQQRNFVLAQNILELGIQQNEDQLEKQNDQRLEKKKLRQNFGSLPFPKINS